jgi:hypothetical protein
MVLDQPASGQAGIRRTAAIEQAGNKFISGLCHVLPPAQKKPAVMASITLHQYSRLLPEWMPEGCIQFHPAGEQIRNKHSISSILIPEVPT